MRAAIHNNIYIKSKQNKKDLQNECVIFVIKVQVNKYLLYALHFTFEPVELDPPLPLLPMDSCTFSVSIVTILLGSWEHLL